ncbi:MAG TPA: flavin reductase [Bacteroidales bacterium]|nr:flavin reductase [Bacteroidales bacterium]HPS17222.1 flavin reductase [Bacteroidales bacterium]
MIQIDPENLNENFIKLIGRDWMLITAGNIKSFNTMTAAWGSIGFLWNRPVALCYVRPTRFTFDFMEKNNDFTLSFFEEQYKDALNVCGVKSGRDTDKIKETGLIPMETKNGNIYFKQARLVMECKKIYTDFIFPEKFIDKSIDKNYPLKDYHKMYIGQIMHCFKL